MSKNLAHSFSEYLGKLLDTYLHRAPDTVVEQSTQVLSSTLQKFKTSISVKTGGTFSEEQHWRDLIDILALNTALEAAFFYYLQREIYVREPKSPSLPFLAGLARLRTGTEIYYSTDIDVGLNIQHGFGIVVGPRFKVGKNFIIHQGVTLGQRHLHSPDEKIVIGDNVTLFAGSAVLGNVAVGDNVQLGANSVLLHDAEPNSVYVGAPAKKVRSIDEKDRKMA